ncbi:MAG: AAA family ATPase [Bacteroidales bacterium]|nr:AAA family ATPase [Bacteroidales bacterium]
MLLNQIVTKISCAIKAEPTPSQVELFKNLAAFILEQNKNEILIVKGYAGTGKTTSLSAFVKVLKEFGHKVSLLAPTGRAAKVFSLYSGEKAFTIHKKIYRQVSSKDGFGKFVLNKNMASNTIFIVDEASMISNQKIENNLFGSGYLLDDLLEFVYNGKNCKLILVGDVAQLPPVGLLLSPALDSGAVSQIIHTSNEVELTHIVRQAELSGILHNATLLRRHIHDKDFRMPLLDCTGFGDILSVSGSEIIDLITASYSGAGIDESLVICRSNKRANRYNQGIRNQILCREEELSAGDLLMVVKNNYFCLNGYPDVDFVANGDIVEVKKVHAYKELYGFRFARCSVFLIDYNTEIDTWLLLNALHSESAALSADENKMLFYSILEDYSSLKPRKKQFDAVKENEFFNALQVKYAYAVTCHKAQGGQWKSVFVDAGYITPEMIDAEYLRWLYTAITRATEKVYLVNFPEGFVSQ